MNYNDLSSLLLKISGLLILIVSIIKIPEYFMNYYATQNFYGNETGNIGVFIIAVLIPFFVTISIGLLLFKLPKTITNTLLTNTVEKSEVDLKAITSIAYAVIGMYFIAFATADLIYWGAYFTLMYNNISGNEYLNTENKVSVIASLAELIIGLVLVLGSNGINNLIIKFRTAGAKKIF